MLKQNARRFRKQMTDAERARWLLLRRKQIEAIASAKGLLKSELKRRNVTYGQLIQRLAEIGVKDTELNIRNKIARGGFTAVFFVQRLEAIGCSTLRIDG